MILLLSGGIDSFVAYHYLGKPKTIYFPLDTPYTEKEIRVIQRIDPNIILDYSLRHLGKNQIGEKAFIPYRNLYLAMEASKYDDVIVIAGIKGDDVSDKTPDAFRYMSKILTKLSDRVITVMSPFWNMTKEEIIIWYNKNVTPQIDLLWGTVSCYSEQSTNYCGKCPSCFRKWVALTNAGRTIEFYNIQLLREYYKSAKEGKYIPERNKSIMDAVIGYL